MTNYLQPAYRTQVFANTGHRLLAWCYYLHKSICSNELLAYAYPSPYVWMNCLLILTQTHMFAWIACLYLPKPICLNELLAFAYPSPHVWINCLLKLTQAHMFEAIDAVCLAKVFEQNAGKSGFFDQGLAHDWKQHFKRILCENFFSDFDEKVVSLFFLCKIC